MVIVDKTWYASLSGVGTLTAVGWSVHFGAASLAGVGTLTAIGPSVHGVYANEVLADSPVAYWRLGESSGTNAVDETGNHDGTYVNSPTLSVSGALASDANTAVGFDPAQSEHVTAGLVTSTPVTFECWFKPSVEVLTSSAGVALFSAGSSSGVDAIYLGVAAGSLTNELITVLSNFSGTTDYVGWTSSTDTISAEWHHLAVVWDGSTYKIYLDGNEKTTEQTGSPVLYDASNVWLAGRSYGGGDKYLDGSLDEVAIYNTALSSTRIAAHYAAGTVLTGAASLSGVGTLTASGSGLAESASASLSGVGTIIASGTKGPVAVGNVISSDSTADLHYLHDGFSTTISGSYSTPGNSPADITWDGVNVISTDTVTDLHYLHSGFSSSITSSYSSPAVDPNGISWDGSNVLSTDRITDIHYRQDGFSSTVSGSYASPDP